MCVAAGPGSQCGAATRGACVSAHVPTRWGGGGHCGMDSEQLLDSGAVRCPLSICQAVLDVCLCRQRLGVQLAQSCVCAFGVQGLPLGWRSLACPGALCPSPCLSCRPSCVLGAGRQTGAGRQAQKPQHTTASRVRIRHVATLCTALDCPFLVCPCVRTGCCRSAAACRLQRSWHGRSSRMGQSWLLKG